MRRNYERIQPIRGDSSRKTARGCGYKIFFHYKNIFLGSYWKLKCNLNQNFLNKCDFIGRIRKGSSTD